MGLLLLSSSSGATIITVDEAVSGSGADGVEVDLDILVIADVGSGSGVDNIDTDPEIPFLVVHEITSPSGVTSISVASGRGWAFLVAK